MIIKVNGHAEETGAGVTLLEYLSGKGLDPGKVVVEYNGHVVKQEHWSGITLKENDQLEVLRFVGGG